MTFSNQVFYIQGKEKDFVNTKESLKEKIEELNGRCVSRFSKAVTYIVVPDDRTSPEDYKKGLPLLNESSIINGTLHGATALLRPGETTSAASTSTAAPAPPKAATKKSRKPDAYFIHASNAKVVGDYAVTMNQTNSAQNNNKFYIIQLLEYAGVYYLFTRWGRVGEAGAENTAQYTDLARAEKDFWAKFKSKSGLAWTQRDQPPKPKKYAVLDMEDEDDEEDAGDDGADNNTTDGSNKTGSSSKSAIPASKLEANVKTFVDFIFDQDMFKEQMASFNIDVKRMPLGKISKNQIKKGFDILVRLQSAIDGESDESTTELTNLFFTTIPHSFGRSRPPVLRTKADVDSRMEMLNILSDIEVAQNLTTEKKDIVENPSDANYNKLECDLSFVEKNSDEWNMVNTYVANTYERKCEMMEVYCVNRHGDGERFKAFDDLQHRKLLWHGTNVAVVVSCLRGGLRIMPHSGGRVGKGIYLADCHGKSSAYTYGSQNVGVMFLVEAALGDIYDLKHDDPSLREPPQKNHSVVARGWKHPDPSKDIIIQKDGRDIIVPQGPMIDSSWNDTSFAHNEYLVYQEAQCRIRYAIRFRFTGW